MEISELFEDNNGKDHQFYVEAGWEADKETIIDWYFYDLEKSQQCFEVLSKHYPCVWLSERGRWMINTQHEGWVYFQWTETCGFKDAQGNRIRPQGRGFGIVVNTGKARTYMSAPPP